MLKIRDFRKARGLTQQQLADMVGVSNVSLSNYERGAQMPDILTISKIANALGVSTDTLIGSNNDFNNEQPRTLEARILATGIDRLPKAQREQALYVVKAMFMQYPELFERGNEDDTAEL